MARARNRVKYAKLKSAGFTSFSIYLPQLTSDQVTQRARAMGTSRQAVLFAAIQVGLSYLTTSAIIRHITEWRTMFGLPIAPRFPGEKFDATPVPSMAVIGAIGRRAMAEKRRRLQEKRNGKTQRIEGGADASGESGTGARAD
jgi:hypothetical protein